MIPDIGSGRRIDHNARVDRATYTFEGPVWRHAGEAAWHFVTLPAEVADEIEVRFEDAHRPFGSVAVTATLGSTSWTTSLFRDTKSASYLLPVKAGVRRRERIGAGDTVRLTLTIDQPPPAVA